MGRSKAREAKLSAGSNQGEKCAREGRGERNERTNERTNGQARKAKMDNLSQTHVVMAMCMDTLIKRNLVVVVTGGSTWTVVVVTTITTLPNNPKHPNGPKSKFSHHHHHHHHQEDPPTQDYALSFVIYLFTVAQRMISRDNCA